MSYAANPNPPIDALNVLTKSAIRTPTKVFDLLRRLHQLSLDQENTLKNDDTIQKFRDNKDLDPDERKTYFDNLMRDKFIALTPDKAVFMYNLVRASGALNVVECGTSFGVSTIYLALAVGQNAAQQGKHGGEARVIATENEPLKAEQARKHWKEAGESVEPFIELREGDLTKTLQKDLPLIDFVLFDIWTPMVMPTLKILEPSLKPGAVILADNTLAPGNGYAEFLHHIRTEGSLYTETTLPYQDGLQLAVYSP